MFARSATKTSRSAVAAPCVLELLGANAAHVRERPLDRADDVREGDLARRLREPVAALRAALARDEPGVLEVEQDLLEEPERDRLRARERLRLHVRRRRAYASSSDARSA